MANPSTEQPFDYFIGIDYSGAKTAQHHLPGLKVAIATTNGQPEILLPAITGKTNKQNWSRELLAEWLADLINKHRVLIGIDHALSFPMTYMLRYGLKSWPAFLKDFTQHWPLDQADITVDQLRSEAPKRTGNRNELRLTEKWSTSAKSVFHFDVQGQVAKSTHTGLPWLAYLRKHTTALHCWPFDGWAINAHHSVIAEAYPSLYRKRYDLQEKSTDENDALAICHWLKEKHNHGFLDQYFKPLLTEEEKQIASLKGWILGIM